MDAGNFEPRGTVDGLAIKIRAANDHNGRGAAPQRIALRRRQRGVEVRSGHHDPHGAAKAGSRVITMLVRPASGLPIAS